MSSASEDLLEKSALIVLFLWPLPPAFGSGGLFSEPFNNYINNFELIYA